MSLTNLITENINDEYCMIRYAGFDIIMCKADQYLNMTKVVALDKTKEGNPKELKHWFANQHSQGIIIAINEELSEVDRYILPIYYKVETGPNNLRGTYCHQLLVPHILSWCSAKFAVKISRIVNAYFSLQGDMKLTEERMRHNELVELFNKQTEEREQDRRIAEERYQSSLQRRKELQSMLKDQGTKLTTLQESSNALVAQLMTMNIKNDKLRELVLRMNSTVLNVEKSISALPVDRTTKLQAIQITYCR